MSDQGENLLGMDFFPDFWRLANENTNNLGWLNSSLNFLKEARSKGHVNQGHVCYLAEKIDNLELIIKNHDLRNDKHELEAQLKASKSEKNSITSSTGRVAKIDIGIEDAALSHRLDLRMFEARVDTLLKWRQDSKERDIYLSPYLVIIQSSGMGKTKLLYEYKKEREEESPKSVHVKLLLCVNAGDENAKSYSTVHELFRVPEEEPSERARVAFNSQLNYLYKSIVNNTTEPHIPVVLLVDEAQNLFLRETGSVNEGCYFTYFRNWLRSSKREVVAVFAGTTSKLSNFFEEKGSTTFSRDASNEYFSEKGRKLYEPFYEFTTSGVGKKDGQYKPNEVDGDWDTDFVKSIPYGRPLFHVMKKAYVLNNSLDAIKDRLQIVTINDSPTSWLSVLSARVQMGQTTSSTASTLVAKGYASLTHFQSLQNPKEGAIVQICHFPDPVLARAAMQIMNEHPPTWSGYATTLFSSGLSIPEKGDIGEIAAALYMLFCGDEIRMAKDSSCKTFSIPLKEWLDKMGAVAIRRGDKAQAREDGKSVSFMQFCRSYVRLDPGQIAMNDKFLEEMHQAAYGIYTYPGAVACDMVAAVSCNCTMGMDMNVDSSKKNERSFEALMVSVKNRKEFTTKQMGDAICKMKKQLLKTGPDKGGVCLLILLARDDDEPLTDDDSKAVQREIEIIMHKPVTRSSSDAKRQNIEEKDQKISSYIVTVNSDAKYGIGDMLQCTTCPGGERAEIYSSHFSLDKLAAEGLKVDSLLRTGKLRKIVNGKKTDEALKYTADLVAALRGREGVSDDTDTVMSEVE